MNIAVTGSSGFVGRRLVSRFEQAGHQVVALDIESGVDLTSWDQVKKTPAVDHVFHLAARTFVPAAFKNPRSFYHTNLISTLNALELCRRNNARFIYASSYIYGPPQQIPVSEDHPLVAHNPYAQTKIIGEELCRAYWRDFSVSSCILRPFNIYGPGQNEDFLIPSIIRQARSGDVQLKDPRPKRDFVYVDDVVQAYLACLSYQKPGVEAFNIGSGISLSVEEVTREIGGYFERAKVSFSGEQRPNEVLDSVADITKAVALLRWEPVVSFGEGTKCCI